MATKFRTPRRRKTRQKSGYSVSGEGTGSTCKIEVGTLIGPENGAIEIAIRQDAIIMPELFERNVGIVGFGFYAHSTSSYEWHSTVTWQIGENKSHKSSRRYQEDAGKWAKGGQILIIEDVDEELSISNIDVKLEIETNTPVTIYGPTMGVLSLPFFKENDVLDQFKQKLSIYIPEILYIDPTLNPINYELNSGIKLGDGHPVVCKSCNRCSRFLPIDIEHERNTLSYSNHCVTRAPCVHNSFARYRIINEPADLLHEHIEDGTIVTHYGHQLECKACKKFFVNLPLNPLRNSTQHREDSLRRRAFEVLLAELLDHEWIYHTHRMLKKREFDVYIWEKFNKICFNCGKPLPSANDMHLDHTMPLVYLWPLDDTATCLCATCNNSKSDKFPVDFYKEEKLIELAEITTLPLEILKSRQINNKAVERLIEKIVWLFDDFLMRADYQKMRMDKKAADLVVHSLNNSLRSAPTPVNLVKEYIKQTGELPKSISLR